MTAPPRPNPVQILSALAILTVIFGGLAFPILGLEAGRDAAGAALLLYVALQGWRAPKGGKAMLAVAGLSAAALALWAPDPAKALRHALAEAAFITGLFSSLGMLRDAAESSPLVRACGEAMARQPPGRRYAVLSLGSHVISLALNFGVLPLLGVMILRGNTLEAAAGDAAIQAIRTRRMMTAILRGFAMMTVWSPLSVAFAVTQGSMTGVSWWSLLWVQLILAALLMVLGWVLDRVDFPPRLPRVVKTEPEAGDWKPLALLTLLIATIVAGAILASALFSARMVVGAMLVVPVAALIWLMAQQGPRPATLLRFGQRLGQSLPNLRYEVAMLGGAMFIGAAISTFIPSHAVAQLIAALPFPPIFVVILMAWSVMALARIGVSQIVTVSLMGGALGDLAQAGIPPLVAASGLMGAWGLSVCATLVGAALLTVARMSDVPPQIVAREWNGRFVLSGAALLAVWMLTLSWILS